MSSPEDFPSVEVALPLDHPVIRIPLSGAVEVSAGRGVELNSSEEARVESFLAANAGVFSAAEDAWVSVKLSHDWYGQKVNDIRGASGGEQPPREIRRRFESFARDLLSSNTTFGTSKYHAQEAYPGLRSKLPKDQPLEASNKEFVEGIQEAWEEMDKSIVKSLEEQDLTPTTLEALIGLNRGKTTIVAANLYALFRQDIALEKVRQFLEDPAVAPAFITRLHGLAKSKEELRECPGLLELLALHVEQEPRENMLWSAIQRSAPDPEVYAPEFWRGIWFRKDLPKELTAALGVMEIAANLVESHLSYDREAFMELFVGQVSSWPNELTARLNDFASGKTVDRWTTLQDALKPFVRQGRLPVKASIKNMVVPSTARKRAKQVGATGEDKTAPVARQAAVGIARKSGDYTDVMLDDAEKEPISHFALLTSTGDKAGMRFTLDTVTDLNEIFELSNLSDYAEKYQSDKTVEPVIRAALAHLTQKPDDSACTLRLKGGEYVIVTEDGKLRERSAWRFSPQHFPGISKGPIASKTRIIYDILSHKNNRTLVIYGAFIKQDIENLSGLPRIRN